MASRLTEVERHQLTLAARKARKWTYIHIGIAAFGLLATVAGFVAASDDPNSDGSFIVFGGAIVWGVVYAFKNATREDKINGLLSADSTTNVSLATTNPGPAQPPGPAGMGQTIPERGVVSVDLMQVIKQCLARAEWNYEESADGRFLRTGFSGDAGSWRVFVRASEDGVVQVDSVLEQYAPTHRHAEVAELLTRINWGGRVGGFQFDYSDGEMRFHTGIDVEGGTLTEQMFLNLLMSNVATMDLYYGAIMAVCFAKADAVTALLANESSDDD
ncbi:hypothetical protein F0U44_02765 [Nocardioides humilatus]|uniref:YbjN domain-containing protein n=1 Tax=Nocardioides humilatus TaxID=2607660 RepID=A0A5B1LKK4_9ACTN|nr:YbjN domain-containing protein [Nocardioides humilatus]KAA1421251.1 hypothetical protein F0U44_02765 [Nocardioides humilatus]